jgi:hypothetical protein
VPSQTRKFTTGVDGELDPFTSAESNPSVLVGLNCGLVEPVGVVGQDREVEGQQAGHPGERAEGASTRAVGEELVGGYNDVRDRTLPDGEGVVGARERDIEAVDEDYRHLYAAKEPVVECGREGGGLAAENRHVGEVELGDLVERLEGASGEVLGDTKEARESAASEEDLEELGVDDHAGLEGRQGDEEVLEDNENDLVGEGGGLAHDHGDGVGEGWRRHVGDVCCRGRS